MCVIFLKFLFLSGAKAVKMCTDPSALVHWTASLYFAFSIKFLLQRSCESLCVIRLSFTHFFTVTSHLCLFIFLFSSLLLTSSHLSCFVQLLFCISVCGLLCDGDKRKHRQDLLKLAIPDSRLCCGQPQIRISYRRVTISCCLSGGYSIRPANKLMYWEELVRKRIKKKAAIEGLRQRPRRSASSGSLLHCAQVPRVRAKAIRSDINERGREQGE